MTQNIHAWSSVGIFDPVLDDFQGDTDDRRIQFALAAMRFTRQRGCQQVVTGKPGYDKFTIVWNADFVSIARMYLAYPDLRACEVIEAGIAEVDGK